MSETKQPAEDKRGAYQSFIAHYNLSPLNNDAIMNCLFEISEDLEIAHLRIDEMQLAINKLEEREDWPLMEIYDKAIWYLKRIKELESQ